MRDDGGGAHPVRLGGAHRKQRAVRPVEGQLEPLDALVDAEGDCDGVAERPGNAGRGIGDLAAVL